MDARGHAHDGARGFTGAVIPAQQSGQWTPQPSPREWRDRVSAKRHPHPGVPDSPHHIGRSDNVEDAVHCH